MLYEVELDTYEPDDAALLNTMKVLEIERRVEDQGKMNPNSGYFYRGSKENLIRLIEKHWDDNGGDLSYMINDIELVRHFSIAFFNNGITVAKYLDVERADIQDVIKFKRSNGLTVVSNMDFIIEEQQES
jgi:hypothetical protein